MAKLSISVIGPLQIAVADRQITALESVKVGALLAYLAVEADHPHRRETLVGLLWPEYPEEAARHNLRQALFNLRRILDDAHTNPPYLLIRHDTIQFNRESEHSLDLALFNHYIKYEEYFSQSKEDSSAYATNLEKALKLYRGEFLEQLFLEDSSEFDEWLIVQRENLHQKVQAAYNYLANYYELQGDYQAARRNIKHQLELDPWREEAHRRMMRVLALDGERTAALAQFETCRRVLADELDVEPSAETRALYEQIRLGKLDQEAKRLPDHLKPSINNLPVQLTPFIGREEELTKLGQLINDAECRCITIVGPGGIGKTRLAIQAAADHISEFSYGAAIVSLASVMSTAGVIPAIANAINISSNGPSDSREYLFNYLRGKQLLFILDNVEQLLTQAAEQEQMTQFLIEVLQEVPDLKLLITTREALNMQGEWLIEVQGLSFPQLSEMEGIEKFDALTLFVQRARRSLSGFALNEDNQREVARICRLVEGMPLAIELAATWVRVLSPAEIANEIEHSLDFLSATLRDLPERHRSIRVVFDHSWRMLSAKEQQVLSKLSVFRGGFQRQAAERVAGASLAELSTLVNRTLLRRTAAGRYDMHELIRQYCTDQLSNDPQAQIEAKRCHYEYYLALSEAAEKEIQGPNQMEWLGKLEQDHNNLRVALEWALEHDQTSLEDTSLALRLAASLRWFWRMRGHFHEGSEWLTEALRCQPAGHTAAQASALLGLSLLKNGLGDLSAALEPAEECIAIYRDLGDRHFLAEALMIAGLTYLWQGVASSGLAKMEEALAIYRELGDRWGEAQALYRLGSYLSDYNGDPNGKIMLEESASILEESGEKYLYTSVQISLGIVDLSLGNYDIALPRFESGLHAAREIKHPWGIADALTNLGCLYRIRGDYASAQARFEESLRVYQEHGRNIWETDVYCAMAENAIVQGDLATANKNLQTASSLLKASDNQWLHVLLIYFQGLLAFYEGEYDQSANSLTQAMLLAREGDFKPDLARSLITLGRVRTRQGEIELADQQIQEGLVLFCEFKNKLGIATALEALANGSVAQGDYTRAVSLLATAHHLRETIDAPLPPVDRQENNSIIDACRTKLGEVIFSELWASATKKTSNQAVGDILKVLDG
jgi:predicted ATPase/DNA-binding SARP family transcriptional activator